MRPFSLRRITSFSDFIALTHLTPVISVPTPPERPPFSLFEFNTSRGQREKFPPLLSSVSDLRGLPPPLIQPDPLRAPPPATLQRTPPHQYIIFPPAMPSRADKPHLSLVSRDLLCFFCEVPPNMRGLFRPSEARSVSQGPRYLCLDLVPPLSLTLLNFERSFFAMFHFPQPVISAPPSFLHGPPRTLLERFDPPSPRGSSPRSPPIVFEGNAPP